MTTRSCLGKRYIGCGQSSGEIVLEETPGNALGAYLDGANIKVYANAQDATGDTMNAGEITIFGSTGDTAGYAMRGGAIYVKENAGYRAGIHMKAYKDKIPAIVIGGRAGSFLGEYQAGGVILVLGIGHEDVCPVGFFCGTGMHGGKIYLRTTHLPPDLPPQVSASPATKEDKEELRPFVMRYADKFGADGDSLLKGDYFVLAPSSSSPYKQMYVYN